MSDPDAPYTDRDDSLPFDPWTCHDCGESFNRAIDDGWERNKCAVCVADRFACCNCDELLFDTGVVLAQGKRWCPVCHAANFAPKEAEHVHAA